MKKIVIFGLFLMVIPGVLKAQTVNKIPFTTIDYTTNRLKNDSVNANTQQMNAFIQIPLLHDEKRLIGTRIAYNSQNITNVDDMMNAYLYGISANLYWRRTFAPGKQLHIFAQAGLYSDLKDISVNNFRYLFGATYITQKTEKLKTGLGLGYARQFFGHQIIPFISVNYKISDRWTFSGALPMRPQLSYVISERWIWVLQINGNVESYRLSEKDDDNAFIQTTTWEGLSKIKYVFAKKHQIHFGLGIMQQTINRYADASSNNWKIITFDLSKRDEPTDRIKLGGTTINFGYSLLF